MRAALPTVESEGEGRKHRQEPPHNLRRALRGTESLGTLGQLLKPAAVRPRTTPECVAALFPAVARRCARPSAGSPARSVLPGSYHCCVARRRLRPRLAPASQAAVAATACLTDTHSGRIPRRAWVAQPAATGGRGLAPPASATNQATSALKGGPPSARRSQWSLRPLKRHSQPRHTTCVVPEARTYSQTCAAPVLP